MNQLQPGFSEIEMDTINEESNDLEQLNEKQKFVFSMVFCCVDRSCIFCRTNVQLNECFDIFEQSYLSISLSRLSDPINLMFSSSAMKLLPTQQELENLIKVIVK